MTWTHRLLALIVAAASTLPALSAPSVAAPATLSVPTPARLAANWLTGQLEADLLPDLPQVTYSTSVEAAIGLSALGADYAGTVADISTALEPHLTLYLTGGDNVETYPLTVARAAHLARSAGADPADFGGWDLIAELEGMRRPSGMLANHSVVFATNTTAQAEGFAELTLAGSPNAASVEDFLLLQQCAAGYFRANFPETGATPSDYSCETGLGVGGKTPNVPATAQAILALVRSGDTSTATTQAISDAAAWLTEKQATDGSWGVAPGVQADLHSTALAGAALDAVGQTASVKAAAGWVRRLQAFEPKPCTSKLTAHTGAVAPSLAAYERARTSGIRGYDRLEWFAATSAALPVLLRAATITGPPYIDAGDRYLGDKSSVKIRIRFVENGERVCVSVAGRAKRLIGTGRMSHVRLKTPAGPTKRRVRVLATDGNVAVVFRIVPAVRLRVTVAKSALKSGTFQTVTITKLAPRETVRVRMNGSTVFLRASRRGRALLKVIVSGPQGVLTVTARGAAADRRGKVRFRIR